MTTQGGGTDFADVVRLCEELGAYCLIGGLAVNCYVEPVYTMDADLVVVADCLVRLPAGLRDAGFSVELFPHSVNAQRGGSQLRIQFTKDPRYEAFPARASRRTVLDQPVMVAALEDVFQGKLWAWSEPSRRLTKRKKDELDLLRLAEAYPLLRSSLPQALGEMLL
ncbi:MAG: nucleotidyl transferase AbiEii/AbiGii toxin family protein [Acidobacteria bacterium]|nr:nucleotidyl transferase AbiEii/AbiGii toxin family protein [Acidobacteriota bacterium]